MGRIYNATSPMLMALSLRILRNREDAEEAMLDVYSKAWQSAHLYDPHRGSVTAWLMIMMRTTAIDRLRSRASREWHVEALDQASGDPFAQLPDPESLSVSAQRRSRIRTALAELPHEQREILEIAYFEGLSHSELSARLNIPLGTAKTRVRRGLERLRSQLDGVV